MRGLVFIHVPKCGGSSFGLALRMRFITSHFAIDLAQSRRIAQKVAPFVTGDALIRVEYAQRAAQLSQAIAEGKRCITGHVSCPPGMIEQTRQTHAWVTLLRNPVARFVSHYNYLEAHHPTRNRPTRIEAFLETTDALRIGSQVLLHFGGVWRTPGQWPEADIARAQATLRDMDLVGDLSNPAQFAKDLGRIADCPVPLLHRNKGISVPEMSRDLIRKIEQVCAPDMELYESVSRQPVAV